MCESIDKVFGKAISELRSEIELNREELEEEEESQELEKEEESEGLEEEKDSQKCDEVQSVTTEISVGKAGIASPEEENEKLYLDLGKGEEVACLEDTAKSDGGQDGKADCFTGDEGGLVRVISRGSFEWSDAGFSEYSRGGSGGNMVGDFEGGSLRGGSSHHGSALNDPKRGLIERGGAGCSGSGGGPGCFVNGNSGGGQGCLVKRRARGGDEFGDGGWLGGEGITRQRVRSGGREGEGKVVGCGSGGGPGYVVGGPTGGGERLEKGGPGPSGSDGGPQNSSGAHTYGGSTGGFHRGMAGKSAGDGGWWKPLCSCRLNVEDLEGSIPLEKEKNILEESSKGMHVNDHEGDLNDKSRAKHLKSRAASCESPIKGSLFGISPARPNYPFQVLKLNWANSQLPYQPNCPSHFLKPILTNYPNSTTHFQDPSFNWSKPLKHNIVRPKTDSTRPIYPKQFFNLQSSQLEPTTLPSFKPIFTFYNYHPTPPLPSGPLPPSNTNPTPTPSLYDSYSNHLCICKFTNKEQHLRMKHCPCVNCGCKWNVTHLS